MFNKDYDAILNCDKNEAPESFIAIKAYNISDCSKCYFYRDDSVCHLDTETSFKLGQCSAQYRSDNCDVYFTKSLDSRTNTKGLI